LLLRFCTTRGLWANDWTFKLLCRQKLIARSQTGKTADQIHQHLWNDWHIAKSNQPNFRYSFQNIILLLLWRHLCIWCLGITCCNSREAMEIKELQRPTFITNDFDRYEKFWINFCSGPKCLAFYCKTIWINVCSAPKYLAFYIASFLVRCKIK